MVPRKYQLQKKLSYGKNASCYTRMYVIKITSLSIKYLLCQNLEVDEQMDMFKIKSFLLSQKVFSAHDILFGIFVPNPNLKRYLR